MTKDHGPVSLGASNLTDAGIAALAAVGNGFSNSDDIWLVCLATDDGAQVCQTAHESASG